MRQPTYSERKLADLLVQAVLAATADPVFCAKSNDDNAAWIAHTLREAGFENAPVGSNWCYLTGVVGE